jgi:hypothetical protein
MQEHTDHDPITLGRLMATLATDMTWGLRGDAPLWHEIAQRLIDEPLPSSESDLYAVISAEFEELTGKDFDDVSSEPFLIGQDATEGMSSGYVDPSWWRGEAIDNLKEACKVLVEQSQFEEVDQGEEQAFDNQMPAGFVELHLKSDVLSRLNLPDIPYPVPIELVEQAINADSQLAYAAWLYGLQETMRGQGVDWLAMERAADSLTDLLANPTSNDSETAAGDDWWLEVGDIDLTNEVITIQRACFLIAAIQPRIDGRLRVASYRPLDAKAASYLVSLSATPHPEHGVCMRENNWEYALDCSAGMGNVYAEKSGESYLSFWQFGVGLDSNTAPLEDWVSQRCLERVAPARTVAQIGAWYTFSN